MKKKAERRQLLRLGLALTLAASGGAGACADQSRPAAPPEPVKNVVLVHGAFVDASSWNDVIVRLQRKGYRVSAVQNPLTSLDDDVKATRRVLARQDGPTILVGYSWGGMPITEAGADPKVVGLVYVAALAPDAGESARHLLDRFPEQAAMPGQKSVQVDAEGLYWIDPATYHFALAHDSSEARTRVMAVSQLPMPGKAFEDKVSTAAWKQKPSWYAVSSDDKIVAPVLQRWLAERMGATTISVPSGHASILSHPARIATLIEAAATNASAQVAGLAELHRTAAITAPPSAK
jgi:pimeloyl-ACP methyl ester carboxylesterase